MGELMLLQGDALARLSEMESESVQMCVTSPPYFGLRDYGTGKWDGGDVVCDHKPEQSWLDHNFNAKVSFAGGTKTQSAAAIGRWYKADGSCPRCGAHRIDEQLGLESTLDEYVARLVAVFAEVRRVLKKDGCAFVNLGDSYCGGGRGGNPEELEFRKQATNPGSVTGITKNRWPIPEGMKPKDLMGVPWTVAFALRADGWWLRSEIIWEKSNPMPESVSDRPTRAHEQIFLLSKSANYYCDMDAIKEPASPNKPRSENSNGGAKQDLFGHNKGGRLGQPAGRGGENAFRGQGHFRDGDGPANRDGLDMKEIGAGEYRNARDVWRFSTGGYSGAHFAVFPEELPQRCILAGSKPGDTILDPFGGSGTSGKVALALGRSAVLIELNPKYCKLIHQRCAGAAGFEFPPDMLATLESE